MTNLSTSEEIQEKGLWIPAITICLDPPVNTSLLHMNNMTFSALDEPTPDQILRLKARNMTLRQLFDTVSFKLNTDFNLTMSWKIYGVDPIDTQLKLGKEGRL